MENKVKVKQTLSEQFIQAAIHNPLQNQKCPQLHPGLTCTQKMLLQFSNTSKATYKLYLIVHLSHLLIFRLRKLKQKKAGQRTAAFCEGVYQVFALCCWPDVDYQEDGLFFYGVLSVYTLLANAVGIFFQTPGRQAEIALFCLNKSMETLYHMARRRNYPVRIPYGECLVLGSAVSIISYIYLDCPQAIKSNYLHALQKIIGST